MTAEDISKMLQLIAFVLLFSKVSPEDSSGQNTCPDPGDIFDGYRSPSLSQRLHFTNSVIRFFCIKSYLLIGSSVITCQADGTWSAEMPSCVLTCSRPLIKNGAVQTQASVFTAGQRLVMICDRDYYYPGLHSPQIECVRDQHWTLTTGAEIQRCKKYCPWPTEIKHGTHTVTHLNGDRPVDGDRVTYFCSNGYKFEDSLYQSESKTSVCRNSKWPSTVLNCVKTGKECDKPTDIDNGNWNFKGTSQLTVGSQIEYECHPNFFLIGDTTLTCQVSGFWSASPPRCALKVVTCPLPPVVEHAQRYCQPANSHCSGYVGVTVVYYCDQPDYKPTDKNSRIECLDSGKWSGTPLQCVKVDNTTPSSNLSTDSGAPNTMTVVIATGSSILGVLVVVLVVVLIQRRKPNSTLWHTNPTSPPAYTRQRTDSVDEHDRVALIAVADGVRVVLPSYDEAIKGRPSRNSVTSPHRSRANSDYRQLPRIPNVLRASGDLSIQNGPRDETSSNHMSMLGDNISVRRQSTLTIGTFRDALSDNFGSIDTMNVSDASTAVTLGTYDSSASNPSLAAGSHQATAGSLVCHDASDEDEDAPLLESNGTAHGHAERTAACQNTHQEELM